MPTNPTSPNTNASVDRLALGVDSPRGAEPALPSTGYACGGCACFEAEASGGIASCMCIRAEVE